MTPEQIKELKKKSRGELIGIIIQLDKKLFHIIKDGFREKFPEKTLSEFMKESIE